MTSLTYAASEYREIYTLSIGIARFNFTTIDHFIISNAMNWDYVQLARAEALPVDVHHKYFPPPWVEAELAVCSKGLKLR